MRVEGDREVDQAGVCAQHTELHIITIATCGHVKLNMTQERTKQSRNIINHVFNRLDEEKTVFIGS